MAAIAAYAIVDQRREHIELLNLVTRRGDVTQLRAIYEQCENSPLQQMLAPCLASPIPIRLHPVHEGLTPREVKLWNVGFCIIVSSLVCVN